MNTAKCPHCGYKHPTYLKPDDFPATLVALNGGHVPTMCDACSALPWEYAERVPRFYGDEGRSRVLGYIRQTLDEIQQAFRPQPVDCAPAAAR